MQPKILKLLIQVTHKYGGYNKTNINLTKRVRLY